MGGGGASPGGERKRATSVPGVLFLRRGESKESLEGPDDEGEKIENT